MTNAPSSSRLARTLGSAAALFALALALRVLFGSATPDAAWPGSAWYDGDARGWLAWAGAIHAGQDYELGLPVRPPGAAYLVAWLTRGDPHAAIGWLKASWCVLGALAVVLFAEAARRGFGVGLGIGVGFACAASTALMVLSTSLNNETPYLALLAASLATWSEVRDRARWWALAGWAVFAALGCLVRVEHELVLAAWLALLVPRWISASGVPAALARLTLVVAVFVATLAPWHLAAWPAIARFNHGPVPSVAASPFGVTWSDEARAEIEALPAATRDTARTFVAATALVRGLSTVEDGAPTTILTEAFGCLPVALAAHPFVSLYGPLNFHLANHALTGGGFERGPLDRPPPLAGGAARYPRAFIAGLPPAELALVYPPHLRAMVDGYRLGWEWIGAHPGDFARLAARKLAIAWSGAALGLGGYDAPLGFGGIRRRVDLAVPTGAVASAWRVAVLGLALAGLVVGIARWRAALAPWLAYAASKLVVTVAFFGYARQGASAVPVVALLGCLALEPLASRLRRRAIPFAIAASLVLLATETWRSRHPPAVVLDGRVAAAVDPLADHDPSDVSVRVQ